MRKLILIGGAMGTGKTTAAEILVNSVGNSVMLDGDWCWQQGCDWHFDEESKRMALDNILYLLERFLKNSHIENVFFAWVLHQREIGDEICDTLRARGCEFEPFAFSLILDERALLNRLESRCRAEAVRRGLPFDESELQALTARAMARMRCYAALDTIKIDCSALTPNEVAARIAARAGIAPRTDVPGA